MGFLDSLGEALTVGGNSPEKASSPPRGQCRQCWAHAYNARQEHAHLAPGQECPACLSHLGGCPPHLIAQ